MKRKLQFSFLWKKFQSRWSLEGMIATLIIVVYLLVALFAPQIAMYAPDKSSGERLLPPSWEHWMGTDNLSYDVWSQVVYGARISIVVGLCSAFFSVVLGSLIGIISGYLGGLWDKVIMRVVDILISIPRLPLMILLASLLGSKIRNIILVLVILSWTRVTRLVRSQIIVLKEMPYVKLAKLFGAKFGYLVRVHFFPEIVPLVMISMIRQVSRAIISEASLSFIGLGDPTSKSWGLIIHNAMNYSGIYRTEYWKWWLLFPMSAMIILVLALSMIAREFEKKYI